MKILAFLSVLLVLVSCGKNFNQDSSNQHTEIIYTENGPLYVDRSKLPLKFYVNEDRYNQYKGAFDETVQTLKSKSGIDLVQFVPRSEDPKYENTSDSAELYYNNNEMWVMFKESSTEFTSIGENTLGLAYYGYNSIDQIQWGQIILNFSYGSFIYDDFRQVLLHEVSHVLGFGHIFGTEISVMNYDYTFQIEGISTGDYVRLHEKYPFTYTLAIVKDLEQRGANREAAEREGIRNSMVENFGLSYERAEEVSNLLYNYQRIKSRRSLTFKERDILSRKLIGVSYKKAEKALKDHIQGNAQGLEELVEQAAEINNTTPEHVQELILDAFS